MVGNSHRVDVIGAEEALFWLHYLVEQHAGTIKGNFPFILFSHQMSAVGLARRSSDDVRLVRESDASARRLGPGQSMIDPPFRLGHGHSFGLCRRLKRRTAEEGKLGANWL